MSKSFNTGRNHVANVATFRNSAGSMKHKNAPRGGARNEMRDYLEEMAEESLQEQPEVSFLDLD